MTPYASLINQVNDSEEKVVNPKLKKINQGYYTGIYKGVKFEILKVDQINASTRNQWYWMIGNDGGDDYFPTKSMAIEAVKHRIDNPHEYK